MPEATGLIELRIKSARNPIVEPLSMMDLCLCSAAVHEAARMVHTATSLSRWPTVLRLVVIELDAGNAFFAAQRGCASWFACKFNALFFSFQVGRSLRLRGYTKVMLIKSPVCGRTQTSEVLGHLHCRVVCLSVQRVSSEPFSCPSSCESNVVQGQCCFYRKISPPSSTSPTYLR